MPLGQPGASQGVFVVRREAWAVIKGPARPADNGFRARRHPICRAAHESDFPKGTTMKKLFYILIVLLLYGLVWVAQASQAALSPLSDHELEAIGGQGGIVLSADHLGLVLR